MSQEEREQNAADLATTARYHKFVRSWTMTNPVHAKVELGTNAVDAWRALRYYTALNNGPLDAINNVIELEEDLQSKTLTIRDFAIGMSADKMRNALLVIGAKTSEPGARGRFSTGAKNTGQLGEVTWHSIKDGLYSSCYITLSGKGGMLQENVPATDDHRQMMRFNAQEKLVQSGTTVILKYSDHVALDPAERMIRRFKYYFSMRDILADPNLKFMCRYRNPSPQSGIELQKHNFATSSSIHSIPLPVDHPVDGEWSAWFQLSYELPTKGVPIKQFAYKVPDYPDASAYLEIFEHTKPLPVPDVHEEDSLQFGFDIVSTTAIHEHSCLWPHLRSNEDMRHYSGRLRSPFIDVLQDRYDVEGPTADNPVSIIDPARLYGLNRAHPFVQWLLSIPTETMELLLRERRDKFDRENGVAAEDVLNLTGNLDAAATSLFDDQSINMAWRETEQGRLYSAVEDHEKFIFVRNVDLYRLDSDEIGEEVLEGPLRRKYVFDDSSLIEKLEQEYDNTKTKLRIDGRGQLVREDTLTNEELEDSHFKTKHPEIHVEVIYSDSPELSKRFRTSVDGHQIRITININSPCWLGQLKRVDGKIQGLDKVAPVLIDTMVQAFARIYVDREIQSAAKRNVVHINNAAAAAEMKYAEEYDKALVLVEEQIYSRVVRAIENGALEDDGVITFDEI